MRPSPEKIVMKEIKISKLFHLLYANLLLAPVFAVGVTCAQTAFTGNGLVAENNVIYTDTDSIHVEDTKPDIWYNLNLNSIGDWGYGELTDFDIFVVDNNSLEQPYMLTNLYTGWFEYDSQTQHMKAYYESPQSSSSSWFYLENFAYFAFRYRGSFTTEEQTNYPINTDIKYLEENLPVYALDKGYQDVFYTSVDTVSQSPFFNWAEKSFIGDGFRYMGNIFGMPTDNPFYTFTCYWCAISILWLIFDVVMYVPKLAHRWLDKGAIE